MALHEPACPATLLTAQAGIGSLDSCFSSTDLLELMQDADRRRRPAEDWASVRQVTMVRMSQLPTCRPLPTPGTPGTHTPRAGTRGRGGDLPPRLPSQHLHQPSGHRTAESSAPARERGSCSPQTLRGTSGGHAQLSARALLAGHVVGSWDKVQGPDWLSWESAGPRGPGLAWACRCREGFTRPPQASRGMPGQEQADSRGPRPGPHRPYPAPSPQKRGSGQNYG